MGAEQTRLCVANDHVPPVEDDAGAVQNLVITDDQPIPMWQKEVEALNRATAQPLWKLEVAANARRIAEEERRREEEERKAEEERLRAEAEAEARRLNEEQEKAAAEAEKRKNLEEQRRKKRASELAAQKAKEAPAVRIDNGAGAGPVEDDSLPPSAASEVAWKDRSEKEKKELSKALRDAAKFGTTTEVVKHLDSGIDPNTGDSDGWTPLILAAENGHLDVVEALLKSKADPKAAVKLGEWGNTALHRASKNGHVDVVAVLVSCSDLHAKNYSGKTAADLAKAEGHKEVLKLLRKK